MTNKSHSAEQDQQTQNSLYAKAAKIYPREVHGLFAHLRLFALTVLLGGYYGVPWLNLGDRQMLLFDLPERKFHILSWTFWPQDFFYLAVILIISALALFFFTALAGRLWCGFACPQTVWTEMFLWIEQKIEGSRSKQMKRDKGPWTAEKIRIKTTKHIIWAAIGLWTGFTFVGYFTPIRELSIAVMQLTLGPWEWFWILFYGFATWGNAGFMREQVCLYMCPYARFQSAMVDSNTLVISYDQERGEPRGARKRSEDPKDKGLGSCIDCTICVQVCPTGIDIRDGLQYQCIGCAACIDACDDVMDKMGYEKGLVRYTTQNILEGKGNHVLRPKIYAYALILLVLTSGLLWSISQRIPLELDVIRDRNSLYKERYDGAVINVYRLKLINMDEYPHTYTVTASGIEGMKLELTENQIHVPSGKVVTIAARLIADRYNLKARSQSVQFTLQSTDQPELIKIEDARFLGPSNL